MSHNPSLKKLIRIIQLAQVANRSSQSEQSVLERASESRERKEVSRRRILDLGIKAAVLAPFSGLLMKNALAELAFPSTEGADPVVIIGGGIAGLVTAYRLRREGVPCVIYEASDRLGGRMFTLPNFTDGGLFCELGGELVDTAHQDLIDLCLELGLPIQELSVGDEGLTSNLFYVGDRLITEAEMLSAYRPLASEIAKDLERLFPSGEVRVPTYKDRDNPIIQQYDRLPLSEYLYSKKNVDQWALDLINVLYVCEFGLELCEQSTLNFLTMISPDQEALKLLGDSDESKRITGGSSSIPNALEKVLKDEVKIHLNHALVKIDDNGYRFGLHFQKGKSVTKVLARQVVCTIPFSVLRGVEGISKLEIQPDTLNCIDKIGYGTNSKLMMAFKSRVWRDPKCGSSNGALLSKAQQQYWETSRMQKGSEGILTQFLGGEMGRKLPDRHLKSSLQLLDRVFPGAHSNFGEKTVLKYWPMEAWSLGSYICLKPGQYTSMHGLAAESQMGGRLLFAGEHTSIEGSGFMNGAIESGNSAALKIIAMRNKRLPLFGGVRRWGSQSTHPVSMPG